MGLAGAFAPVGGVPPTGLYVVDISDPSSPQEVASLEVAGSTRDVEVHNNLVDAKITSRNGATILAQGNVVGAHPAMFKAASAGDLHLRDDAPLSVSSHPDCLFDWDGAKREKTRSVPGADDPVRSSRR